jgi:hypothetical protein
MVCHCIVGLGVVSYGKLQSREHYLDVPKFVKGCINNNGLIHRKEVNIVNAKKDS